MSKSRRQFLTQATLSVLGAAVASRGSAQQSSQKPDQQPKTPKPPEPAPGTPPAFGTAPPVGPEVSPATFAEAEKLMQIELTAAERNEAAGNWRSAMAPVYERRIGPHKVAIEPAVAPYSQWDPILPGEKKLPLRDQFIWSKADPEPLPKNDADIAFAPLTRLARWIEKRELTSERLTGIYLERLERFNPKLRCVITLTRELALAQSRQADREIAAGKSEKEIADRGVPGIWRPWFGAEKVPSQRDFMQEVYATLTHTSDLNQ